MTDRPKNFVPLCVPLLRGNERRYVAECFETGYVSSVGPFVERFEEDLSRYLHTLRAVATVNGTAALHTALRVAGVRAGDEVLVPCLTFIAPANAVRYLGAWPIFIGVEEAYLQMDPDRVEEFLSRECHTARGRLRNRATGRPVTAILPVHLLGHPVDMDPIGELAGKYDLRVVEDASESLGARYRGRLTGTLGDIGCFSFNGNKVITTGGGGMLVTDREAWADEARYLTTQARDDPDEYIHGEIGYNYRLPNLLAAVGCAQIEVLDAHIEAKRAIADRYAEALSSMAGITCMREAPYAFCTFWLYTVRVQAEAYGEDSRGLRKRLWASGIESRPLWQPLHRSPAHEGAQHFRCGEAEALYRECLSLPCSVGLSREDQDRVIELLAKGR